MIRRLLHLGSLAALLGLLSGCTDRTASASTSDGGVAVLSASVDGGDGGGAAHGDAGTALEDTAMPHGDGEQLAGRMRHLLEAIAQSNADLANDVLFPREGYMVARDIDDPGKLWEKKVQLGFRHSVERTHKHMHGIEEAKFVSFELGHSVMQLSPKKKEFKKPLWRVKHSRLTFSVDGKPRTLDIAEMTAWRGHWYVTKLR